MPCPTSPACNGSWPDPPPEISTTLPDFGRRRRTKRCSSSSAKMSECAATSPSRLSVSTVSTLLINFFIELLLIRTGKHAGNLAGEIHDQRIEAGIALRIAEIGQGEHLAPHLAAGAVIQMPDGMRLGIGVEKPPAGGLREVAELEDRVEMADRNRCRILRIGDLRH